MRGGAGLCSQAAFRRSQGSCQASWPVPAYFPHAALEDDYVFHRKRKVKRSLGNLTSLILSEGPLVNDGLPFPESFFPLNKLAGPNATDGVVGEAGLYCSRLPLFVDIEAPSPKIPIVVPIFAVGLQAGRFRRPG